MVRDCLHPVMLHGHVGTHTHTLQRALLSVHLLCQRTPPPCPFKNWPLIASSWPVVEEFVAVALKRHMFWILSGQRRFGRLSKTFGRFKDLI